jgi:hypothetical protein
LLIVLLAGIAFTSCGDDNDENEQSSSLVGTWETTEQDGIYWDTDRIILNSNGTGKGIEHYATNDPDKNPDSYTFRWSYNESKQILTIVEDDTYDDDSDTYYYYVYELSSTSATLYGYENGKIYYNDRSDWTRVK